MVGESDALAVSMNPVCAMFCFVLCCALGVRPGKVVVLPSKEIAEM